MALDRRIPEAGRLRDFFHEQMQHLSRLLDSHQPSSAEEPDDQAIELLVSRTDGRIRSVHRYKKLLREAVARLLEHISDIVRELPEPTLCSQQQFSLNPQLKALFVTPSDMQLLFSRNRNLQAYFNDPQQASEKEVFTLLSVTVELRDGFGCALQGDQVVHEVPRTTVNFTGHQLSSACASHEALLTALQKLLFESTVDYLRGYLAHRKQAYYSTADQQARVPKPSENLNNPAVYLQALLELITEPISLIRLEHDRLCVDRLGILHPEAENCPGLELNELKVGEWGNRAIFLVRYPRDELLSQERLQREFNTLIF